MKYKMDERESVIKGNIQPFDVHEVRYEDTCYFLHPIPGIKVENRKKSEIKNKEALRKFSKVLMVIYLDSDSESSNSANSDEGKEESSSKRSRRNNFGANEPGLLFGSIIF